MYRSLIPAVVVLAAVASNARGQAVADPQAPVRTLPAQTGQASQAGAAASLDEGIATCIALGNQEEIALAQFAEGRVQNERVKEFVQMMIKDHRAALQKLHQVAPQLASQNLELQAGQGAVTAARATPGQTAGGMNAQMTALQRRVAQECLTLTQKELGEREGADFDRCYIGQQIGAHIATLAKLRGSREFASGQLQQFIQEAERTVEGHLAKAKEIGKELEASARDGSAEQARRDGVQPRRQ